MKQDQLLTQIFKLLFSTILFAGCSGGDQRDSKEKNMERNHQNEHTKHAHGHGFSDKASAEKMAKLFESAERDSMQRPQKVIQYLGNIHGKILVDIGSGTGYFSVKFAEKGANVIAADVSDEFQKYLRERIEKNSIKNITPRKTLYDNPLLNDGEADIAFIANTYHHIENRADYFSKVKKGLKVNGELIVVDYFCAEVPKNVTAPPIEMRVPVDQVVFELRKAGFSYFDIDVNALPYQYMIKAR